MFMKMYAQCIYNNDGDDKIFTEGKLYEVIEYYLGSSTNLVNDIYIVKIQDNYGSISCYPLHGRIWGFKIVGGR